MHPFMIFGAVLYATTLAVIGFFVLFAASRAAGLIKGLGTALGIWVLVLSVLIVVGAAALPFVPGHAVGPSMMQNDWMGRMHGQVWRDVDQGPGPPAAAPSPQQTPTTP